jgi:hypothetical protein
MMSEEDLRRELAALEKMTAKELRGKYRELFGDESRTGNRQWLFRRCAWRLQARGALRRNPRDISNRPPAGRTAWTAMRQSSDAIYLRSEGRAFFVILRRSFPPR